MGYSLFLIAVNLGPFLLAGLPWLTRRVGTLFLVTALIAAPLSWLWASYAQTYYHLVPDEPILPVFLLSPGLHLLVLIGSAAIRALWLDLRRPAVLLGAFCAIILVANVALPAKMKQYNWEQSVISLAQDSFYRMGERLITLPRVAVRRTRDAEGKYLYRAKSDDPINPLEVSDLQVSFYPYRSFGETSYSRVICPHLVREWSRRVCDGERTGLYAFLPYHVTFLKGDDLETVWNEHQHPATQSVAARIARRGVAAKASDIECEPKPEGNITHMCHVAVALGAGLVAVWQLPARDVERAPNQAAAVAAWFEYGLGQYEDVNALRGALK